MGTLRKDGQPKQSGGRREGAGRIRGPLHVKTAEEVRREQEQKNLKGGVLILSETANHLRMLLARYQPGGPNEDVRLYFKTVNALIRAADAVAAYEVPKLATIRVQQVPYDLSKLTDEEFAELDRLTTAAAAERADRAGEDSTRH